MQGGAGGPSLQALGERIYKSGIGVSGKPIAAIDMSGQKVFAPQFHCAACHRTSGYGSREGGVITPPIPASILFQPLHPERTRAFNSMYFQPSVDRDCRAHLSGPHAPRFMTRHHWSACCMMAATDPAGQIAGRRRCQAIVMSVDVEALEFIGDLVGSTDPGVDGKTIHKALILSNSPGLMRDAVPMTSVSASVTTRMSA